MSDKGYVQYLPTRLREPIEKVAAGTGYDPETVFVGTLAAQEIAKLPKEEQSKAIAIVIGALGFVGKSK